MRVAAPVGRAVAVAELINCCHYWSTAAALVENCFEVVVAASPYLKGGKSIMK